MSAFTTVIVRISKTNTKSLTVGKKSVRNLIEYFRIQNRCFLRFWSWRCRRFRTKRKNKFACSKISSSMSAMLFALIFPRAERAGNLTFPLNEMPGYSRLCDRLRLYGNSSLCDRLRSFAIIWKPALIFQLIINWIDMVCPRGGGIFSLYFFLLQGKCPILPRGGGFNW